MFANGRDISRKSMMITKEGIVAKEGIKHMFFVWKSWEIRCFLFMIGLIRRKGDFTRTSHVETGWIFQCMPTPFE